MTRAPRTVRNRHLLLDDIFLIPKKKAKKPKKCQMENNSFMTYCTQKRFTSSWTDVTKTFEENATMSFSLNTGLKLALPSNNQKSKANHDRAKDGSVSSSVGFHEPRGRR